MRVQGGGEVHVVVLEVDADGVAHLLLGFRGLILGFLNFSHLGSLGFRPPLRGLWDPSSPGTHRQAHAAVQLDKN